MSSRRRTSLPRGLGLVVLLTSVLLVAPRQASTDEPGGYVPVAPTAAIHVVLKSNLKTVFDWLDEKDFVSAAEATSGLATLAHLQGHQSADVAWRRRCAEVEETAGKLGAAARRKSRADCDKLAAELGRQLEQLEKDPAAPATMGVKDFKPRGSVKTWMVLLDSTHVDAKSARSAKEFKLLTQAVAAEANALAFLHQDAAWRKESFVVRDLALRALAAGEPAAGRQATNQVKDEDLAAARQALQVMRRRCETCHDRGRR